MEVSTPRKQETLRKLLADSETHTATLLILLLDRYGMDALEWTPETMAMELQEDVGTTLPEANVAKLAIGVSLLRTDRFFHDMPFFVTACNVLSGDVPEPGVLDLPDAEDCAWGITEALLIYPPEEDEPFSEEIRRYLGAVLEAEGIDDPPDILRLAITSRSAADVLAGLGQEEYGQALERQRTASDDLQRSLKENLSELFRELEQLPLVNGSTKAIVERVRKNGLG